jgi:hypothetical protein
VWVRVCKRERECVCVCGNSREEGEAGERRQVMAHAGEVEEDAVRGRPPDNRDVAAGEGGKGGGGDAGGVRIGKREVVERGGEGMGEEARAHGDQQAQDRMCVCVKRERESMCVYSREDGSVRKGGGLEGGLDGIRLLRACAGWGEREEGVGGASERAG